MTTIYDVASEAGLSTASVSRVINGDKTVRTATRLKVEAAIAKLGFVPSRAAQTMKYGTNRLVGVITGALTSPADRTPKGLPALHILQAMQYVLSEHDITVMISDTGGQADRIPKLLRVHREYRAPIIVYIAEHHAEVPTAMANKSQNVLLLNCYDAEGTPALVPDDRRGQYDLVSRIIAEGHHRIGFLTLPENLLAHHLRLAGYKAALADAGIGFDPDLVRTGEIDGDPVGDDLTWQALDDMLALDQPPTCFCCANDRNATKVYGILRSRGVRVPEDISIAGFDDDRTISETLVPQLTTMELPYQGMGLRAGQLITKYFDGNSEDAFRAGQTLIAGRIGWRNSVLPVGADVVALQDHTRRRN